ncbi:hypothetical protein EX30DRAFT_369919 [Ascodesmis nigricans]|uniref:Non-classical export protein 1 n=1 Tax=Ascodesmis nigricans TaxID=341454 RepID=A0A4S2N1E9_9PEZI|nr:hypothetical protein EX30DRAFT_369919 [Ascodesmis nigricans]
MSGARYLISRVGDPIFALFIGASAATLRIRREEIEAGRTPAEAVAALKRRVRYYVPEGWGA